MTPLAIYGFERMSGFWIQRDPGSYRVYYEWIEGGWCLMEVATIVAGLVAVWFVRFPFLTFPIAFSAWFTSMDVAPLIYGRPGLTWDDGLRVSLWFGVLLLVISWFVDRFMEEDFAFWGYLFGMFAFWDGLSLLEHRGEISAALYCLVNVVLIGLAVPFDRRVFAVFGAIGVYAYLGHLSYVVFNESVTFPFVLGACGLSIIWLGMLYERYRSRVREALAEALPTGARALLPKRRVST